MPIAQLSDATSRLLKSTLVLNDASTVIKELVDNALDARASVISIEISANALDTLQVKDNGTGIGVEDRQLLCKRGCTSKIRTIQDLERLGGKYLGFRGEAMSSIAALSESVIITTRVEGEAVGTMMKFGPQGKLMSSSSASHPVGTTIKIQKFLEQVPVRRQAAIKASSKVLANTKRLLFAFAFVRPKARCSLKVIKHENDKANWSFAPCEGSNQLPDVAMQIFGKDVAAKCMSHNVSQTDAAGDVYEAQAYLLDRSADVSNVATAGQFIAIDGRPVTAERGLASKIAKLYHKYLKSLMSHESKIPSKPFLVLQISCPVGSYDVNVEPAKDEVLFLQSDCILELVNQLFSDVYGPIDEEIPQPRKAQAMLKPSQTAFNLLLARKITDVGSSEQGGTETLNSAPPEKIMSSHERMDVPLLTSDTLTGSPTQPSPTFSNMYGSDDHDEGRADDLEDTLDQDSSRLVDEVSPNPSEAWVRNPFTTAVLHTKIEPRNITAPVDDEDEERPTQAAPTLPIHSSSSPVRIPLASHAVCGEPPRTIPYLPTPSRSPIREEVYQNPGPPIPRHGRRRYSDAGNGAMLDELQHEDDIEPQQRLLRNWMQSSNTNEILVLTPEILGSSLHHNELMGASPQQSRSHIRYNAAYSSLQHHPGLSSQKAFKSPLKRISDPAADKRSIDDGQDHTSSTTQDPELDQIMDFEHRKRAINHPSKRFQATPDPAKLAKIQRSSMVNLEDAPILFPGTTLQNPPHSSTVSSDGEEYSFSSQWSNPHKNRYEAALRALESRDGKSTSDSTTEASMSVLDQATSSHQSAFPAANGKPTRFETAKIFDSSSVATPSTGSKSTSMSKKVKKSTIPFETIPKEYSKHNIQCLTQDDFSDLSHLQKHVASLNKHDTYIKTGQIDPIVWSPFSRHTQTWESILEDLIKTKYKAGTIHTATASKMPEYAMHLHAAGHVANVKVNLTQAVKGHIFMLEEEQ